MKKDILLFILKAAIYAAVIMAVIVGVNYFVDSAYMISANSHEGMAKLELEGNKVAVPENYNERIFQICIAENMKEIPSTIVIGTSRGMFLGEEVTGYDNLYNACISNSVMEDYYGLISLYYSNFGTLPKRVIMEVTPSLFFAGGTESRWMSNDKYFKYCESMYETINGHSIEVADNLNTEDPYTSIYYFKYNIEQLGKNGFGILSENAKVSTDESEAADMPDGSTRYVARLENPSDERLKGVQAITGALTYDGVDTMTELDSKKVAEFESLIDYLVAGGTEVIIYMQPYSVTQCEYSFDQNLNPAFMMVQDYLVDLCNKKGLVAVGGYDARDFGLTDNDFIDNMHLDKNGTRKVWDYSHK